MIIIEPSFVLLSFATFVPTRKHINSITHQASRQTAKLVKILVNIDESVKVKARFLQSSEKSVAVESIDC